MASAEDEEELLLSCRFGDLEDVQHFITTFNPDSAALDAIQDDNGNSLLHMAAANGHTDILGQLLPRVSPHLIAHRNNAGSTPLHWAALNRHVDVAKLLVEFPAGPGINLIDAKNDAGRSPLAEAEIAGWDEGAQWFVQMMHLDQINEVEEVEDRSSQAIEMEIQDADGQLAKLSIHSAPSS